MITTTAICTKIEKSDSNNVSFVFFRPQEKFTFQEWQFMFIEIPNQVRENWKSLKNAYSIWTTSKQLAETWEIGFIVKKASEDGVSNYLTQQVQVWDEIVLKGPLWHFVDKKLSKIYLFISIGSWVTPIYSLYDHLLHESKQYDQIINLFGERYTSEILPSILTLFQDHNPKITNFFCLSKEENLPQWWSKWYVQASLDKALDLLVSSDDAHAFICGKPQMCDEVSEKLLSVWFTKSQMTIEKY